MLDLYEIRKDLHRIPELGFEEVKTVNYILSVLNKYSCLKIHTFKFPGIIAEYSHWKGKYKLFRADLDALPIHEKTNCDFQSEHPGKMHACGHDIHLTVLIGLIERVIENNVKENILFLFQPAEEGKGGAQEILKTGILDKYDIEEVFALHVSGKLPVGAISSKAGIFFANTEEFDVLIKGKDAHVAFPENGIDALNSGNEYYRTVINRIKQNFTIPRSIICAFGKMTAGKVRNAVASECKLEGTFRTFFKDDREKIKGILERTASEISKKNGVKCELKYLSNYSAVKNNKFLYDKLKQNCATLNYKFAEAEAVLAGEDFGFLTDKYKGLLFWLGARGDKVFDLHSSSFLPDKKAIDVGIDVLASFLRKSENKIG
ncbi:MAG: amidohydrolase [Candidatus Cloacimonetes bacterium]|nr:amidohydrolase [Candidatus Cloacimonadota bacterium]